MDTWKLREAYYADAGRADDKSVEDKIARRVLRAVGYRNAEKGLAAYEVARHGASISDMPLWPRVRQMMYDLIQQAGAINSGKLDIQALTCRQDKELADRMAVGSSGHRSPAYLTLEDGACWVYTLTTRGELATQTLPFHALEGPGGLVAIKQTAQTFARACMGVWTDGN